MASKKVTTLLFLWLIIQFHGLLSSDNPLVKEILEWSPGKEIPKGKSERIMKDTINFVIDTNNQNSRALWPLCILITKHTDIISKTPEVMLKIASRDPLVLNHILYTYKGLQPEILIDSLPVNEIYYMLYDTKFQNPAEHAGVFCNENSFRVDGQTYIPLVLPSEKLKLREEKYVQKNNKVHWATDEHHEKYWSIALDPMLNLQVQDDNRSKWSVENVSKNTMMLLLCLKNKKIKVPRFVLNQCIVQRAFGLNDQSFDGIKNRLQAIGVCLAKKLKEQYDTIEKHPPHLKQYVFVSKQMEFFKNFPQWYKEKTEKLLSNKMGMIKELIAYHRKKN